MRGELIIARREFRTMMREKGFALVLIFEALLVSSSAFLSIGYGILTSPESSDFLQGTRNVIAVGLVTESKREFAAPLQKAGIAYYNYQTLSAAEKDFQAGLLDAILIGSVDLRSEPSVITVYLPSNTPKTGIIKLMLKRFFLSVEEKLRDVKMLVYTPQLRLLRFEDAGGFADSQNFEVFMVFTVPLLFFMPAVMAGSLIIDSLTEELESGRILNLLTAPIPESSLVAGKCIGSLAVTIPHCIIWLAVLSFTDYGPKNPVGIIAAFTLYTVFFILAGAIISLGFKRNRPSQMAYTLLSVAAITLMSPEANVSPALIHFSPARIFTGFALGDGIKDYILPLVAVGAANAFAYILLRKRSAKIL